MIERSNSRVLVIGATGFVGSHLAARLVADGDVVLGLARTPSAAARLEDRGLVPVHGDLSDLAALVGAIESLAAAGGPIDAIVFAPQVDVETEHDAVDALVSALPRLGHPEARPAFVFLSGTGVLMQRSGGSHSGLRFTEDDPFEPEPLAQRRVDTEELVRGAAARGVRGIVLRPGEIWGPGDHSRVRSVYASVGTTGAACFVGEGTNAYSHVHVDDVAELLVLALATAPAGAVYHAVSEEVSNREIADAVAEDLGVAVRSLGPDEAVDVWGEFGALIMGATSSTTAPRARAELGWEPRPTPLAAAIGLPELRALAAR